MQSSLIGAGPCFARPTLQQVLNTFTLSSQPRNFGRHARDKNLALTRGDSLMG